MTVVYAHRSSQVQPRRPISSDQERALLAAAKHSRQNKPELIDAFLPRISGVAREYRGVGAISREELMQAGVLGFLRAVERYDPSRPNPFWAYASWWVRQAMQEVVSSLSNPVALSDRAHRHLRRINDARRDHLQSRHSEPTIRDLAAGSGLSVEQVRRLLGTTQSAKALHQSVGGSDPTGRTIEETLPDPAAEDPYEEATLRATARVLPGLLAKLSPRERAVVRARYGLDDPPRTLRDVGVELGISPERVRQIEERALRKLREAAEPRHVVAAAAA
jgi:RNA polymerase sigma factor (sigma-70 family)